MYNTLLLLGLKANKMDLQADISWIKKELDKVQDPDFLEAVKSMFNYRKKKSEDIDVVLLELLTKRALKSEEDIKTGKTYTIQESAERIKQRFAK